jgi:DNA-binding transcriptional LysR family regulator
LLLDRVGHSLRRTHHGTIMLEAGSKMLERINAGLAGMRV